MTNSGPTGNAVTRLLLRQTGAPPTLTVDHDRRPLSKIGVRVAVLQSPILPSDRNLMAGTYAYHPPLPCELGREGVGHVTEVGVDVTRVSVGDRVIGIDPYPTYGFWATETVLPESAVWVVPDGIPDTVAATLSVNGLTAWLLLTQFQSSQNVVQNAANSSVGAWVNYWATELGIQVINVVRRPAAIHHVLQPAGPVVVEGEDLPRESVGLALNAVGGESAGALLKALAPNGTMVTYGALSKAPVPLSNAALIYRQLTVIGFLRSNWVNRMGDAVVRNILDELADRLTRRPIKLPAAYPMLYPQTDFTDLTEKTANRLLGF